MLFRARTERTRTYLEQKYGVDLTDTRLETPLYVWTPEYSPWRDTARVPYVSSFELDMFLGAALGGAITWYVQAHGRKWVPSAAVAALLGVYGMTSLASRQATITHELAHAAAAALTDPDPWFSEALAIHEEMADPNATPLAKSAAAVLTGLAVIPHARPLYKVFIWHDILRWMDGPRRERALQRLEQSLYGFGAASAGQLCAMLYEMGPREYVEDHMLLQGVRQYARTGDDEWLMEAFESAPDTPPERRERYERLIAPASVW